MSYCSKYENDTFLYDSNVRITDYEGLLKFLLSQPAERVGEGGGLFEKLSRFVASDEDGPFGTADLTWDGDAPGMLISGNCDGYDENAWKVLAPFLSGCMEWHTEEGNAWLDVFDGQTMKKARRVWECV